MRREEFNDLRSEIDGLVNQSQLSDIYDALDMVQKNISGFIKKDDLLKRLLGIHKELTEHINKKVSIK